MKTDPDEKKVNLCYFYYYIEHYQQRILTLNASVEDCCGTTNVRQINEGPPRADQITAAINIELARTRLTSGVCTRTTALVYVAAINIDGGATGRTTVRSRGDAAH